MDFWVSVVGLAVICQGSIFQAASPEMELSFAKVINVFQICK